MKRTIILTVLAFFTGIAFGAYLFSDTQPRSPLRIAECEENCFSEEKLLGLLGSVGVQKLPNLIPFVVKETDRTVAMKHPFPQSDIHYVIIPKKDIKTIEDITSEDAEYITDAHALMAQLIREQNLTNYKVIINGPRFQTVEYLHFHLVAELSESMVQ
jgi:histidine triad (HIT) family protein